MAKKRKAEDPGTTLHDYFGSGAGSGNKKPRPSFSGQPSVPVKRPGVEVIEILDSDEEIGEESCIREAADADEILGPDPTPSAALEQKPESGTHNDERNADQDIDLEEELIISDDEEQLTFDNAMSSNSANNSTYSLGDEWGHGDDEAIPELEDGDVPDEFEEEERDVSGQIALEEEEIQHLYVDEKLSRCCPICEKDFTGFPDENLTLHVNRCLDIPNTNDSALKEKSNLLNRETEPQPEIIDISSSPPRPQPPSCKPKSASGSFNAFSVLMSRNNENEAWKEATAAEYGKLKPQKKVAGNTGKGRGKVKSDERDGEKTSGNRRHAPFYKVLQGMPVSVDAFRYGKIPGVTAYFLTHAHSDHYTNLSSSWKHGPIYCSEITANLIIHMLKVDQKWVHPLPMDIPTIIPDTNGVEVVLMDANHCPGSSLFLFSGKQTINAGDSTFKSAYVGSAKTFRYLHCGDFRACPEHVMHPAIMGKKLDIIYLDTTYLDPKYCFPPQKLVIDACAELAKRIVDNGGDAGLLSGEKLSSAGGGPEEQTYMTTWLNGSSSSSSLKTTETPPKKKVLVVVGTYSIGKERIVKSICDILHSKLYCDTRKAGLFACQNDPHLNSLLSKDPIECDVHVLPLQNIASDKLGEYLERWKGHWDRVVGFRPTGWSYTPPAGAETQNLQNIIWRDQKRLYNWSYLRPNRASSSNVMVYGVPYSEHSSFFELTCFALSTQYVRMIATVNVGSAKSRGKMDGWFEKWLVERQRREREKLDKNGVVAFRHREYW